MTLFLFFLRNAKEECRGGAGAGGYGQRGKRLVDYDSEIKVTDLSLSLSLSHVLLQEKKSTRLMSDVNQQRQELKSLGLRIKTIESDGNCLFRALADQATDIKTKRDMTWKYTHTPILQTCPMPISSSLSLSSIAGS